jgi:hypothetical protein
MEYASIFGKVASVTLEHVASSSTNTKMMGLVQVLATKTKEAASNPRVLRAQILSLANCARSLGLCERHLVTLY